MRNGRRPEFTKQRGRIPPSSGGHQLPRGGGGVCPIPGGRRLPGLDYVGYWGLVMKLREDKKRDRWLKAGSGGIFLCRLPPRRWQKTGSGVVTRDTAVDTDPCFCPLQMSSPIPRCPTNSGPGGRRPPGKWQISYRLPELGDRPLLTVGVQTRP